MAPKNKFHRRANEQDGDDLNLLVDVTSGESSDPL
jgi:hypothetical protein